MFSVICIHEEEITEENLNNGNVVIDSSTNLDGIQNIIVGGNPFQFSHKDEAPNITVTFSDPKIPLQVQLLNTNNVVDYNLTVFYMNGDRVDYTVSEILFL